MTTIIPIATYDGDVPNRSSQGRKQFNINIYNMWLYQKLFGPDLNARIGEFNTVAGEVNGSAAAAAGSAAAAAGSAAAAASSANAGLYSPTTTYDEGDRAIGSDGNTYGCLVDGTIGDNPVGSVTGKWIAITVITSILDFTLIGLRSQNRIIRGGLISDGGGLDIDYTAYVADIAGTYYSGAASSVALTGASGGNELRFVYVNSSGAVVSASTAPSGNYTPLGIAYVTASDIVSFADARLFAPPALGFPPVNRPAFKSYATDQLDLVGPGQYPVFGVGAVWFTGTISHTLTSLAASTRSYIYIDKSALLGPGPFTGSAIYDSTTAPTYDSAKGGYYNGDDLCIMCVWGLSGSTYAKFYHDGGRKVRFEEAITVLTGQSITTTPLPVTLAAMPSFATKATVTFFGEYTAYNTNIYASINGSTLGGHIVGRVESNAQSSIEASNVAVDGTQKLEIFVGSNSCDLNFYHNGFYLGKGM